MATNSASTEKEIPVCVLEIQTASMQTISEDAPVSARSAASGLATPPDHDSLHPPSTHRHAPSPPSPNASQVAKSLSRGSSVHRSASAFRKSSIEQPPPTLSFELMRSQSLLVEKPKHKIKNVVSYHWRDCLAIPGSVLPNIILPTVFLAAWALWWTIAFMLLNWKVIGIQSQLITILSVVIGLLLVFRTNTAYDRYYEARRLWGIMFTHTRNLGRFIWVTVITNSSQDLVNKFGAINLLLAYAVATKHYLRDEKGFNYDDLYHLIQHLPDYRPGTKHPDLENLPLEISLHLSSYISKCRMTDAIDVTVAGQMMTSLSTLVDCLSNFERIRNSPIPRAYSIHLKQTVMLYILALPFQLVAPLGWATIPIVFIAAFTLLGIEAIGGEIENPFGYDPNDLDLDHFCEQIKNELEQIIDRPVSLDPVHWETPIQINDFKKLVNIRKRYPKKHQREE